MRLSGGWYITLNRVELEVTVRSARLQQPEKNTAIFRLPKK